MAKFNAEQAKQFVARLVKDQRGGAGLDAREEQVVSAVVALLAVCGAVDPSYGLDVPACELAAGAALKAGAAPPPPPAPVPTQPDADPARNLFS